MRIIETYFHAGEGYNPFLIGDGWQVAQLNFQPGHEPEQTHRMEVHQQTDEAFILFKGRAALIAVESWDNDFVIECVSMEPGVSYNIPAGVWHNIAMDKDARLIIVEKSYTHLHDVTYRLLTENEKNILIKSVNNTSNPVEL